MRRLSGFLLAGAILSLLAVHGDGSVYAQGSKELTFDGDTAIITVAIKPDKTADFEQIMKDLGAALMKSEKPERKQQAAGWKVVKSATPIKEGPAAGSVVYMHVIDPVVKGADYTILTLLYETNTDPAAQKAIYDKYREAFAGGLGQGAFTTIIDLSK